MKFSTRETYTNVLNPLFGQLNQISMYFKAFKDEEKIYPPIFESAQ